MNKTAYMVVLVALVVLVLPAAAQSVGSRDNPVPIGTSVDMGNNWQITVLSVFPNATDEMVYGRTYLVCTRPRRRVLYSENPSKIYRARIELF